MVSSVTSGSAAGSQATSRKSIAQNFDTFLQLLTTQLKNQNPLDPMDTNQFTQQLVQFTSVEQALKTNEYLASLVDSTQANRAASASNYLGTIITADGSTAPLSEGSATWYVNAPRAATSVKVNITDSSGQLVYSADSALEAGGSTFTWDGRTNDGTLLTGGMYKIQMDARDAAGQTVAISTEVSGKVDAVDLSSNPPLLKIGTISIPLDKVKTLRSGA